MAMTHTAGTDVVVILFGSIIYLPFFSGSKE